MKIIYLITLLWITGFTSAAQTADFTYSTAGGNFCAPQAVQFTQTATGSPQSFLWDFGNGKAGNNPVETITYLQPGTYTVRLTAVYSQTTASITKTITIYPTPQLNLTANRTQLCQPGDVIFTTTTGGGVNSYEWNFGDGTAVQTTSTGQVTHFFSAYNDVTVSVKALNAQGCFATDTIGISIQKLAISGSATPAQGCIPATVSFNVQTGFPPGDGLQQVTWNYGDGSAAINGTTLSGTHVYTITSPVTATATISSTQGCSNSFSFPPMAYGTPPTDLNVHTVSGRDSFCASEIIDLYGKSSTANEYTWDFGGGNTATITDTLTTYRFPTLGPQVITVKAIHNGCEGITDTIRVFIKGVIAAFAYSNTCSKKTDYSFTNSSEGTISSFYWKFSDTPGLVDSINYHVNHSFPPVGTFTSSLLLVDNTTGCRDSISANIYTAVPRLTSNINMVCKDSAIIYKVMDTYPALPIFNYLFHATGTVFDNDASPVYTHYPTVHGIFNEYVVISDGYPGTCDDSLQLSGPVTVRGPVADFESSYSSCMDTAIILRNLSHPYFANDRIISWKWDFGDSQTDASMNPGTHLYSIPGTHNIALTAIDINGCGNTKIAPVIIHPVPIVDILPSMDTLCSGQSLELVAYSIDSVHWSPTTNINCVSCDTVIVNPTVTTAYIAHTINSFGCKSADTSLIKVFSPFNLQVTPAVARICPGESVALQLNATGFTTWTPPLYLDNANSTSPVSTAPEDIRYTVKLVDSAGCFTDSATADIFVYPMAVVDAGPDQILPYNSSFTLNPIYSPGTTQYWWSPPVQLSCTDCAAPAGIAQASQTYLISITDINGCRATDQVKIIVQCEKSNILLPNAFTPDGDGLNDYFYPITRGYRAIRRFAIFDRFGNKVFERQAMVPNQRQQGWDGKIKGAPHGNTQAFTWFLEGECDTGEVIFNKGTVILIR